MANTLAPLLVLSLVIYAAVGVVFAVPFVLRGVGRIDPAARDGTWGFRLLILPGCVALWPLLARRWLAGSPPPVEHSPHRDAVGEIP